MPPYWQPRLFQCPALFVRFEEEGHTCRSAADEERTRFHVGSCLSGGGTAGAARQGSAGRVHTVNSHSSELWVSLRSGSPAGRLPDRPVRPASPWQLAGGLGSCRGSRPLPPATDFQRLAGTNRPAGDTRPVPLPSTSRDPCPAAAVLFQPASSSLLPRNSFWPLLNCPKPPGPFCTPSLHHGHLSGPCRPGGRD